MDGIILAAGKGTRMRELTRNTPKPLLEIQGKPLLEWSLRTLRPSVDHVLIVVSYLKEQIADFMQQQTIFEHYDLVEQPVPLGTGDALRCCQQALTSDEFIVMNGDDLFDAPSIARLAQARLGILTVEHDDGTSYGVVVPNEQGHVLKLHEKPPAGTYPPPVKINIGVYRLNRAVFDIPLTMNEQRGEYEITQYISELAAQQPVSIVDANFWFPVGTPAKLEEAQTLDLQRSLFRQEG
jgi:bifunctional UDP-N-acetylglucosamine pyrophosphorylase/glucosamine-1-phosphate N-acetyltransferase